MNIANSFHLNRSRLSSRNTVSANGSACAEFTPFPRRVALQPEGEAMPVPRSLPRHLRPRREKLFGDGRPRPLDRNAKARIMHRARALMHRTEKGKHYGKLTAKYVAVLEALLWSFHNARSGLCFPSYETIAERAKCTASTVGEAIKALEDCGLLSWVNRIVRIRA